MKEEILNSYKNVNIDYPGNSNSLHKLGLDTKKLEDAASKQILKVLGLIDYEVIYTSGNAESFTMVINNVKNKIVTDNEEFRDMCKEMNREVVYSKTIDSFPENVFISTKILNKCNHIDLDLDKKYDNLNNFDYITIEDEIPGFGVLIKRKNICIENLIHGGKSTTKYRSGTAPTPLIVSFSKLVKLKYKK